VKWRVHPTPPGEGERMDLKKRNPRGLQWTAGTLLTGEVPALLLLSISTINLCKFLLYFYFLNPQ
jgi:hypothetical protein